MDDVSKIDPSNEQQMKRLWTYFSHNTEVINWWLNTCVLPCETQQYPKRLCTSSWHVAGNPCREIVGFSGTNDNHRLLPLQVHQHFPEKGASSQRSVAEELHATNGKMLATIIDNPRYDSLAVEKNYPSWQALLDKAYGDHVDAILDCGALLAGVPIQHAVKYLLNRLDRARFKGICYFDNSAGSWMVSDVHGRCLPRHASSVMEHDTVTIFDEARCRGADLQLRLDAVGLLTLGPRITKVTTTRRQHS